ncbi:hypothetical protein PYW08_015930 [Mythimna loreyi]|uniref:Uncharacterized protein n=1 Tax=Mythimna loreyi TaxID=667449 RepID=A0ACC2QT73_9NEOP|nr:hypothetical protein PYW08_015930 [Mythimna loreyi]
MNKKKPPCECPTDVRHICRPTRRRTRKPVPPDVAEIMKALTMADYIDSCERKKLPFRPPKFKTKPFRPPHIKETCVPMKPSMHTRLRYIGHCPLEPASFAGTSRSTVKRYLKRSSDYSSQESLDSGGVKKTTSRMSARSRRRVRYDDLMPGDILLPAPCTTVRHSTSSKSILSVPSPKTSGEVIQAQRATVKPSVMRPPIPAKSGHELFKPHSGIILNRDQDFVPEVVLIPGSRYGIQKPKKPKPCYKGGVCLKKKCPKKQCRKYFAQIQKKKLIAMRIQKRQGLSKILYRGVTDGKPRARAKRNRLEEKDNEPCGLDEIPRPEHIDIPANLKRGTLETHSLTVVRCTKDKKHIHYGILTGTFNMYDAKYGARSRGRQALPISVMAFCLAFHYHPKQWTMKLIDNLMDSGDVWYLQLLDKVHDHSSVQGICEVLPFGKKQIMLLNGKRMQVLLCEPDIVGYTMSLDPMVYNLCRGLKAFFLENRAGILLSRVLKLVIWKDNVCYYIFDPAGRDSRAYSNFANGRAALMNVKDVESVAEVLLARSILEDQKFLLAPIKILKMADEKCDEDFESDKELTQAEKAMMGYRILNAQCAIVNANMHLGDRCFEDAKFRQALPIAIVAMTYAKISPPNTWFAKTLDKILRLGNKLYVDCTDPKVLIDITIDNIPNEIMLGPYACEIIIYRERVKGQLFTTKECIFNIKTGLEDFFSHEYNSAILEFNNYTLALWRQKDMFYMFDPYPRTTDGLRTLEPGKACCMMVLNAETMAKAFKDNWDYLPPTTQFYIHAFKVLKLKKKNPKIQLYCRLSVDDMPSGKKKKRKVLPMSKVPGDGQGDQADFTKEDVDADPKNPGLQNPVDEEKMGDIISLVDSIQEDYVPPVPMRYKKPVFEPMEFKVVNLDSPTVSVTQVVPPWPKPRDKTDEPIEPDPDPEPTPPPTPPPIMPPEGAEEEEKAEEEEDEEMREERLRKKAEEEEARRKAEELPPPLPPPPPSPQPEEDEPPLAPPEREEIQMEDELQTKQPVKVDRHVLLTEDAQRRFKLRKIRNKISPPLMEDEIEVTAEQELEKPTNFRDLPDSSQIIRGQHTMTKPTEAATIDKLPFGAIIAIVTSYKYSIHSWTPAIVDFVVNTALKLYDAKQQKFQMAPAHVIPKIALGHQAYHANIDVFTEGASWQLEDVLEHKFFPKYDRGMITTSAYSCAIFKKNGLYYLFDGTPCTAMGLRDTSRDSKGKACFLRFRTLHDLASRINYNKDGKAADQQFIISRILVRKLLKEPRTKLPEDYDYFTGETKSPKSKQTILDSEKSADKRRLEVIQKKSVPAFGYQLVDGIYRLGGTTALTRSSATMKACHFVCLIAMLMATMHPVKKWERIMVDVCIEKGLEIYGKATNLNPCEKRVIKNVILDGKLINVNIKKILVVNENTEKKLEQYLKAVLRRLRYVIIRYPICNFVICQTEGQYHFFDPYPPPRETPEQIPDKSKKDPKKDKAKAQSPEPAPDEQDYTKVATWTLYRTMDGVICRIKKMVPGRQADSPEFYTFELTSIRNAPRHAALYYRLSPLFKPDINPNTPFLKSRRKRLTVVDEKMYWLSICTIPWSRMNSENDLGLPRKTPRTMWKDWDIEFPGDLYSLWGTIHPLDDRFDEGLRGKQYLATSVVAIGMTQACHISAWTSGFIDGIVVGGNSYHEKCVKKVGGKPNHEIELTDLESKFDDMFPFVFSFKFDKVIFGFVYNIYPDRFNLSKALVYFFENDKNEAGILTSPGKNLAFGRIGYSYFMFDCQSFGAPIFSPGQGAAYILKCESLNRLIHCMTLTLNIRTHGQQFHLYSATVQVSESNSKRMPKKEAAKPASDSAASAKTESGKTSPAKGK